MSILFSPLSVREVTFKNRIVVSPMCQYSAQDGFANDWHLVHLGSRAVGGAGLIIAEATSITPEGRISPEDLGIWKDEHIPELKRITNFIHQHGAVAGVQLAHAGRKASSSSPWNGATQLSLEEGGWQTLAPSAIAFNSNNRPPLALDKQGIERIISSFKDAAERALEAGFQLIEIHAAHGYLINQFLSPLSNQREDEYGGSFENRIRLLLEVIQAIREVWPESYPLFVRISATDWVENGWQIEDSIDLSKILKTKGVDLIDCSSGGVISGVKIPLVPGYQSPLAEAIRKNANILTAAVGLITDAEQAEQLLQDGKADLILFARESLRNPYLPLIFAQKLNAEIDWPLQYERAKPR
ncbi:NADPH dehydrogenase NamA [Albibacterium bauzanense]|uniref:2,4-dienoyl-CoA reductase-like NADH-dependent reductase (Old Yellow Enzyme family) n=1 Tax=Albibacterium bauzanense TaxID=653929 RepID=A0A4R1M0H2_9SPHI|nr:NADPH dehydrogenase NamA [Albibacterium bauzanense]TCK85388.1 2,4-dienoyl-CoA reductase-like NADH-dependent reductase (Old Yellow Enzyme family) [Albibacterium bauzanense]